MKLSYRMDLAERNKTFYTTRKLYHDILYMIGKYLATQFHGSTNHIIAQRRILCYTPIRPHQNKETRPRTGLKATPLLKRTSIIACNNRNGNYIPLVLDQSPRGKEEYKTSDCSETFSIFAKNYPNSIVRACSSGMSAAFIRS